jgi:hypothetical protein
MADERLNVRRLVLDVDKAFKMPSLIEIAAAIQGCRGVAANNIIVTEIDQQTIGTVITIEGEDLDYDEIVKAIEETGAVVHSLDEIASGQRVLEPGKRSR